MPFSRSRLSPSALLAITGVLMLSCGIFFGYHSGQLGGGEENADAAAATNDQATRHRITSVDELNAEATDSIHGHKALPKGITDIDGEGGRGIHRMVLKNGVWYPVYDPGEDLLKTLSNADPDHVPLGTPLNAVPLAISSASPPKARAGEAYSFRFQAVGGEAPYQWSMQLQKGAEHFTLDSSSGRLSGQSEDPFKTEMQISLTDETGRTVSASYSFVVSPEKELSIDTTSLEVATVGQPHTATIVASGGMPPYQWSMTTLDLPAEWMLDATSGLLSATASTAGEFTINVTVKDTQETTASQSFVLKVSAGLDITTPTQLLPAAPGGNYAKTFEAVGGTPPYSWQHVEGALPPTWTLSSNGQLSGTTARNEASYHFTLEVTDTAGLTFRKSFDLAVRDALLAIPSREKVGLAWPQAALGQAGFSGVAITRSSSPQDAGSVIYQGAGSNTVDHGIPTGSTVIYTLWGLSGSAEPTAYARAQVTLLPMVKNTRATAGQSADPFADAVKTYAPLSAGAWGSEFAPDNVTGPPWSSLGQSSPQTFSPANAKTDVLSLHTRNVTSGQATSGSIVLEFKDNIIELGNGTDFSIFENVFFIRSNPNNRFMEPAIVSVALFEGQWFRFPVDVIPTTGGTVPDESNPSYFARGFAGRNATTGDDPTDPLRSGGDAFDIQELGIPDLTWVRFIKIETTGHNARLDDLGGQPIKHTATTDALSGQGSSGFDLDAVSAVNY